MSLRALEGFISYCYILAWSRYVEYYLLSHVFILLFLRVVMTLIVCSVVEVSRWATPRYLADRHLVTSSGPQKHSRINLLWVHECFNCMADPSGRTLVHLAIGIGQIVYFLNIIKCGFILKLLSINQNSHFN